MKIRIVEHVLPDRDTYYTVQRKAFGLFWISYLYTYCNVTCVDRVPIMYVSHDAALEATKSKLGRNTKKQKNYYYFSAKELST